VVLSVGAVLGVCRLESPGDHILVSPLQSVDWLRSVPSALHAHVLMQHSIKLGGTTHVPDVHRHPAPSSTMPLIIPGWRAPAGHSPEESKHEGSAQGGGQDEGRPYAEGSGDEEDLRAFATRMRGHARRRRRFSATTLVAGCTLGVSRLIHVEHLNEQLMTGVCVFWGSNRSPA
jgi:hypothetical protein